MKNTMFGILLLIVVACGHKGGSSDEPSHPNLDGTWLSACTQDGDFSSVIKVVVVGLSLNISETSYSNKSCVGKDSYVNEYSNTFTWNSDGTRDITMGNHDFYTVSSAKEADSFNSEKVGNYTDWSPGVTKDLIGYSQNAGDVAHNMETVIVGNKWTSGSTTIIRQQ